MAAARGWIQAVRDPAPSAAPGPIETFLLQPRVYDVLSVLFQLAQWRRYGRIKGAYAASDDPYLRSVHDSNVKSMQVNVYKCVRRMEELYGVLRLPARTSIPTEKILIVGPRTVSELLMAWLYGFRWRNISAIDLFSTHPKIQVMDMHRMRFPDGTFDGIVMANVISYSSDIRLCLSECARVLRPGGRLILTHNHLPSGVWISSGVTGVDLTGMLSAAGFGVYFHDSYPRDYVDPVTRARDLAVRHLIGARKLGGVPGYRF